MRINVTFAPKVEEAVYYTSRVFWLNVTCITDENRYLGLNFKEMTSVASTINPRLYSEFATAMYYLIKKSKFV